MLIWANLIKPKNPSFEKSIARNPAGVLAACGTAIARLRLNAACMTLDASFPLAGRGDFALATTS